MPDMKPTMDGKISPHKNIDISINNPGWSDSIRLHPGLYQNILKAVLDKLGIIEYIEQVSISLLLTDDKEIQLINKQYRGKDEATNVLSFPALEFPDPENLQEAFRKMSNQSTNSGTNKKPIFLGDVVMSFDTLQKESEEQNKSFPDHFSHLFVHSILHLLGFDHQTESEQNQMEQLEIDILSQLGISNPYII